METIKISVTQPRVANPLEATTSRYGIIVIADNKEILIVREGKISEYMDFAAPGYYRLAAMVNVTRPAIMLGMKTRWNRTSSALSEKASSEQASAPRTSVEYYSRIKH